MPQGCLPVLNVLTCVSAPPARYRAGKNKAARNDQRSALEKRHERADWIVCARNLLARHWNLLASRVSRLSWNL